MQNISNEDQDVIQAGYKPQLQRKVSTFNSFAISFSWMSVLMGVFANYAYVLQKGGPFGIWTWIIVGLGQLLVGLVFADLASRIPITGALYNWNDKMGHTFIGWLVGWCTIFAYSIGASGVIVVLMIPLQSFLGITFSQAQIGIIGVIIILIQAIINIWGVKLTAYVNRWAVIGEMVALLGFGLLLTGFLIFKGHPNFSLLTTIPDNPMPYWPAFLACTLLGAWTIFGFEAAADLSEETVDARKIAPKSIINAILTSVIFGFIFLVIITVAIPDVASITAAADPVSSIVSTYLGSGATEIFLFFVLVAMFATSLLGIALSSRILFAISRDGRFFGHQLFKKVSSHGIPIYSAIAVAIVEAVVFLTLYSLSAIFAAAVVLLFVGYLATIITFAMKSKVLPSSESFSLGIWKWPVIIFAIIWLVVQIAILTIPSEFNLAAEIGGGVILVGAVLYLIQSRFSAKAS